MLCLALVVYSCEKSFEYQIEDVPDNFTELPAPREGEGYQIHIPPFPVPANYERELFIRMPVGNTEDIYVKGFQSHCRPGTHHLIAYGYNNENAPWHPEIGVMRDQNLSDGRGNLTLTMGSGAMYYLTQEPENRLDLPPGVAMKIPANATVDMNSHYFNLTDEMQFGEAYLNFYTMPKEEVVETLVVESVDNEEELFLPPKQNTTVEYEEMFYEDTDIRYMVSHMHKRGKRFEVFKVGGDNDGDLLYASYDYQHAPQKFFEPPLQVKEGEGLRTIVKYENETNREITFGVTSEDEMGILFFMKVEQ